MPKHPHPGRQPVSANGGAGLGPDLLELQQARALWQRNRFDESLQLFEKAVRKCPRNLLALVDASRAFGARFEIAKAESMLDRLIKLGGWNPKILHLAGQSYRMIFRPEKAMDCFQRVVKAVKDIPDAQLELAVLYERRHRVDEAFTLVEECLRAAPDYFEARLLKARLLRRRGERADSEAILRALTANDRAHRWVRAQAWTELAQMLDRQEQFDEAMKALLQGKELLRGQEEPYLREAEVTERRLLELTESVTAEHFRRWTEAEPASERRALAVLTSFPRSGTTLLEQVLDAHSGVVSSDEREVFARDIFRALWHTPETPLPNAAVFDSIPRERLAVQRERYWRYMEAALNQPIGARMHLDKNPSLTLLIPGLLRLFPETKLLIALRDPRDVVLSCFMQFFPLNGNSVCYLTLERTARRYATDMGAWRRFREMLPDCWCELRYEEAVADLEGEARRALGFLGLAWEPQVLAYRERLKEKVVASPTYEAVSQPLYRHAIGRWKHYEKYLEPTLEILRPFIGAFGYG